MKTQISRKKKIHPVVWPILGGLLLMVLKFFITLCFGIDFTPWIPYMLIFIIGAILAIIYYLSIYRREEIKTRDKISNHDKKIHRAIAEISSRLTLVSWTSDIEEHDTNVFQKMSDILNNPSIKGMDVFSIFRQEEIPTTDKGKKAVSNYYTAIEDVVKARGFRYRRAVVVRQQLMQKKKIKNKAALFKSRIAFNKHWEFIHNKINKGKAEIKVFFDEGRVIDIAFALFYQGNVHDKDIVTLVLEISVWSLEKEDHIMGLLVIEKPNIELVNAFHGAFVGLYEEKLNVKGYSYDEI